MRRAFWRPVLFWNITRRFGTTCRPYLNPLNAELNPIRHLLALLGGATIVVVSRLRVKGSSNIKIHLADDREIRPAFVNATMKLWVS
jgi:hypothetical protein